MNIRNIFIAAAVAVVAVSAFAALSTELVEWGKGPAQFLMTKEEAARWKTIRSDDDAAQFVALFWARRDPTPDTPRNEFREQFEIRVTQADKNFQGSKTRGALTDRGRALILYGQPSKIERTGQQRNVSQPSGISTDPANSAMAENNERMIWTYEGDAAKRYFNMPRAQVIFVDRFGNSDFRAERGGVDLASAQNRAIQAAIIQPDLTTPPAFDAPQAAAPAPAEPAAPVVQTELATASLKNAVAEFRKSGKSERTIHATSGEFVTADGETFVPVLVYIPKTSAPTAATTFFGVVEDASGKSVLAFEEPAELIATKDDFFVDKTLTLPAGKHRGFFGLATGDQVVALTAVDMELAGTLDKDAPATSRLILSNNVFPMSEAQRPTEPFAFGGLKVVPKADKTFRTTDELWYFVELRNLGLPEEIPVDATKAMAPPSPKVQVKLDVEGKDAATGKIVKRSAPPMEVEAIELKGVPHHYGLGSSIPLSGFKAGDYTFTVKVIDTIKKQSWTLTDNFKVVE